MVDPRRPVFTFDQSLLNMRNCQKISKSLFNSLINVYAAEDLEGIRLLSRSNAFYLWYFMLNVFFFVFMGRHR